MADDHVLDIARVENNIPPAMSVTVTAGDRNLPLCSYPSYPKYRRGAPEAASSYECAR